MRPGGPRQPPTLRDMAVAFLGLVVLAVFSIAAVFVLRGALGIALALVGLVGYLVWLDWPSDRRRRRLERGACPTCGYDLAGLPPTPTGPAACPECGKGKDENR